MGSTRSQIRTQAASVVAYLTVGQAREVLRLLLDGEDAAALEVLREGTFELPFALDLADEDWREAILDELDAKVSPESDEDPDAVRTTMVPNYAAFAKDLRADDDTEH